MVRTGVVSSRVGATECRVPLLCGFGHGVHPDTRERRSEVTMGGEGIRDRAGSARGSSRRLPKLS